MLFTGPLFLYNLLAALQRIHTTYKKAEIQISSEGIIYSFNKNKSKATALFVGKAIETRGVIKTITYQNDEFTILLKGENKSSYVICIMQSHQHVQVNQMVFGCLLF
ncbi:OB-fold protein [Nonlabens sp.]|uniref:OB-fold protein n=1 Tax=Nonlabens sp. TaxID=1888209 RepID=UPI0039E37960